MRPETRHNEVVHKAQEILSRIQALRYNESGVMDRQTLANLEAQYNALVDDVASAPVRLTDMLEVLPYELWVYCLEEVVDDNAMNILPLTLVSRRWREALVSSPSLWTHIYVRDDPAYMESMRVALHLSQGLHLSLTMEIPLPESMGSDLLRSEANRIRSITFKRTPSSIRSASNVDVTAMDHFYDSAYGLLVTVGCFPVLESVSLNHGFDFYSLSMSLRTLPIMPHLRRVKYWCITVDALAILGPHELTYMSSSSPLEDLYASISQLKRLKRLIMTQAGEGQDDSPRVPEVDPSTLPDLYALEFYQSSPRSLFPFLKMPSSTIQELHVKLSWIELSEMAPLLARISMLNHLHLILKAPTTPLKGFEILLPRLPSIRRFELEQQPYIFSNSKHLVDASTIASLLHACEHSIPNIENLLLAMPDDIPISPLLSLLTSMTRLIKFEFKGHITKEAQPKTTLPYLEEIVLSTEALLSYINIPNALDVYIALGEASSTIATPLEAPRLRALSLNATLASMIECNSYPDLISLTWIDPAGGCASIAKTFRTLTKICFDYASPRKECNDFCELLLRYPYSCPKLETIEMRAFPEWDIVFHMLRRRNFLPGQGVSRISTVRLPGFPGLSLLEPLTELLGGRFPNPMPSIAELSLSNVDGPYFDIDV